MYTYRKKIDWAIRFAGLNLEILRPGDRLNLKDELHEFFVLSHQTRLAVSTHVPVAEVAKDDPFWGEVQSLQNKVRGLLGGFVKTKTSWGVPIPEFELQKIKVGPYSGPPVANPDPAVDKRKAQLSFSGPWQDMFILLLNLCLWQENVESLSTCPECGKVFLRNRRQVYCGRACVNRATVRAWRKSPKGKKKEGDRKKEAYRQQVRKRLGANVRVGKRITE